MPKVRNRDRTLPKNERSEKTVQPLLYGLTMTFAPACIFIAASVAGAQTGCTPFTGFVHDTTDAIIPGASIRLDDAPSIFSDSAGRFRIACVPAGRHTLRASFAGFTPLSMSIKFPHLCGALSRTCSGRSPDHRRCRQPGRQSRRSQHAYRQRSQTDKNRPANSHPRRRSRRDLLS